MRFVAEHWLTLLGIGTTIVFGVVAIVFYLRGRRIKRPVFFSRTVEIASRSHDMPKMKMIYEDVPVERITVTRVAFLNAGNETIDGEDIAPRDTIQIRFPDGVRVLDATIAIQKNPANDFTLLTSEDRDRVSIVFDYMDRFEGCVIQIVHNGPSECKVTCSGSIKGAGNVISVNPEAEEKKRRTFFVICSQVAVFAAAGLTILAPEPWNFLGLIGFFALWVCVMLVLGIAGFVSRGREPQGFDWYKAHV